MLKIQLDNDGQRLILARGQAHIAALVRIEQRIRNYLVAEHWPLPLRLFRILRVAHSTPLISQRLPVHNRLVQSCAPQAPGLLI